MIAFSIDLDRINHVRIFTGKTGRRYLSFILITGRTNTAMPAKSFILSHAKNVPAADSA